MNDIKQLQADKLELNQRLHATQNALLNFKGWYMRKHATYNEDCYAFEGHTMLRDIISESYPMCDPIIEELPIPPNTSGITCKCEQLKALE